jgi:hypothetical protein
VEGHLASLESVLLARNLDDCVGKDRTFYKTKEATWMESSSEFFVQRTRHKSLEYLWF